MAGTGIPGECRPSSNVDDKKGSRNPLDRGAHRWGHHHPGCEKQVEERVAVGVNVVYETIRREGEVELARTAAALAWSALAAGLSMGFSFVAEALLRTYLPESHWAPLISKAGYSVGFLIVILGRQQLFTENTLTVILPILLHPTIKSVGRVARLSGYRSDLQSIGHMPFCLLHRAYRDLRSDYEERVL